MSGTTGRGWPAHPLLCVWLLLLLASRVIRSAHGDALYTVGESYGWKVPPVLDFYDVWASGLQLQAGDCLTFQFEASQHDVLQVSRQSYLDCGTWDPYLVLLSPNSVLLEPTGIAADNGTINFISGDSGDCRAGMRFSFALAPPPSPVVAAPVPSAAAAAPRGGGPGAGSRSGYMGRHYSVGDTFGWSLPPHPGFYNASWVSGKLFVVFDTLYFAFEQGAHNVLQVSRAAYDSCNRSSYLSAYNLANPTVKLVEAGTYWFICGKRDDCARGMKLAVTVYQADQMPPPPPPPLVPAAAPSVGADDGCPGRRCFPTADSSRTPVWVITGIILSAVLLVAVVKTWIMCCMWKRRVMWKRRQQQHQPPHSSSSGTIARSGKLSLNSVVSDACAVSEVCVALTRREIELATRNFAPELEVGSGASGTVYRGTLADGTVVAIKRSKQPASSQELAMSAACKHFVNEVTVLCNVNHRNLVRLLGYCVHCDAHPALVYEYVSNGTLLEHLQGERPGSALLQSWPARVAVALQTAEALAYLHFSAARAPIYHRDVKSANILLDDDLRAKVADFGISRLVGGGGGTASAATAGGAPGTGAADPPLAHLSTGVVGTFGYIDPEYHATGQVTDRSDVYSFGVVLLELITGQLAVDWRRNPHVNLAAYCIPCVRRCAVQEVMDPRLGLAECPAAVAEVQQMAELALVCLAARREERPSMKEVVEELVRIKLSSRGACGYTDKVKNLDLSPLSFRDVEEGDAGRPPGGDDDDDDDEYGESFRSLVAAAAACKSGLDGANDDGEEEEGGGGRSRRRMAMMMRSGTTGTTQMLSAPSSGTSTAAQSPCDPPPPMLYTTPR